MNWALARSFWMHRLRSKARMILILLKVSFTIGAVALAPGSWSMVTADAVLIAMLLGFGVLSQDVSSGAAQMILVRPVGRFEYVLSRYVATCLGTLAICLAEFALVIAIVFSRGLHPAGQEVLVALLGLTTRAVSMPAAVVLLSSVSRGLGDLGIYAGLFLAGAFFEFLETAGRQKWATWAADGVGWLVAPGMEPQDVQAGGSVLLKSALQLLVTIVGCVALGYVLFRRRELTYSD